MSDRPHGWEWLPVLVTGSLALALIAASLNLIVLVGIAVWRCFS